MTGTAYYRSPRIDTVLSRDDARKAGIRRFGTGFPGDSELRGRECYAMLVLRRSLDSRFSRRFSGVGKEEQRDSVARAIRGRVRQRRIIVLG